MSPIERVSWGLSEVVRAVGRCSATAGRWWWVAGEALAASRSPAGATHQQQQQRARCLWCMLVLALRLRPSNALAHAGAAGRMASKPQARPRSRTALGSDDGPGHHHRRRSNDGWTRAACFLRLDDEPNDDAPLPAIRQSKTQEGAESSDRLLRKWYVSFRWCGWCRVCI